MCGRFTLTTPASQLVDLFSLIDTPELNPRYNIAPTQLVACVRRYGPVRRLSMLRWGLIPYWAKDAKIGARMINARAETVRQKSAFRKAFEIRRCLIPADGFFEWTKNVDQSKQPWLISIQDGTPFAFAGLWEIWHGPDNTAVESCTIVTTTANAKLSRIHNRMPVILNAHNYDAWLDSRATGDQLHAILIACADDAVDFRPVNPIVNNANNDVPECIAAIEE